MGAYCHRIYLQPSGFGERFYMMDILVKRLSDSEGQGFR